MTLLKITVLITLILIVINTFTFIVIFESKIFAILEKSNPELVEELKRLKCLPLLGPCKRNKIMVEHITTQEITDSRAVELIMKSRYLRIGKFASIFTLSLLLVYFALL